MPKFLYKARARTGEPVTGTVDAPTEGVVQEMMREKDLILLSVKEARPRFSFQSFGATAKHVSTKDLVVFSRQLAVLISATVPIVRALRILAKQTESKHLHEIVTNIANEVDGGARLSAAMKRYPRVFDDFFVYMIRAGETTGRLDEVLVYLADQKEKDYQLFSRVISSMIYPSFIVVVLIAIFIFMMVYVVPKLLDVVTSSGAELPLVTKILIGISNFFQFYWWLVILLIVASIGGYLFMRSRPAGKVILDRIKLHIPVIGTIFRNIYLSRITRSLANLLASGVPVNKSIEIVGDIVGNAIYHDILHKVQLDVEAGRSLSESLTGNQYIPPMMTQMIDVGEETGRIDQILSKISEFYASQVATLTTALVSLVEPLIIILLGGGALLLVTGILMPIYAVTAKF
jgi:type IV pilus assembly protein PilC